MRILYIAKHDSGGNDDEGAITHALRYLGHEVFPLREAKGHMWRNACPHGDCDFLLFHKWDNFTELANIPLPKVFWYFDLVHHDDITISRRCQSRVNWMVNALRLADLGFCTDGDWVESINHGTHSRLLEKIRPLIWLRQGADQRVVDFGHTRNCPTCTQPWRGTDILFTGTHAGGEVRASFVKHMKEKYGKRFTHVESGVYGRALADLIASATVVVAPDGPVSDRYWSNRVYTTLGFGGFLIHPYCKGLTDDYTQDRHLLMYQNRDRLDELLTYWLTADADEARREFQRAALEHTRKENTYINRCAILLEQVRKRLNLGA